ncbi:MAG: hypothetical protein AABO58_15490 [Acidobacteriota bacterium]
MKDWFGHAVERADDRRRAAGRRGLCQQRKVLQRIAADIRIA